MGVAAVIFTKVFPRIWEYRSDSRELGFWGREVGRKGLICSNS